MRPIGLILSVFLAAPAFGQGRSLEGTTVTLKMDMPASSEGVDVYPNRGGIDFRKVADRLKATGIGVHNGESIMITKVILKKDHIEVQLGGGGYGTFADRLNEAASSAPYVPYESKSRREKDLEAKAKYDPDYWDRREARDQLKDERSDRYRDNAMAAAVNAQNQQIQQANVRAQRAQSGSRFNVRYSGALPEGAATPKGIMDALSRWVDFGDGPAAAAPPATEASSFGALRKGLTIPQVEQILGPAAKVSSKAEGSIETMVREYATDGQQVVAQFVGGVLVDYRISPR